MGTARLQAPHIVLLGLASAGQAHSQSVPDYPRREVESRVTMTGIGFIDKLEVGRSINSRKRDETRQEIAALQNYHTEILKLD